MPTALTCNIPTACTHRDGSHIPSTSSFKAFSCKSCHSGRHTSGTNNESAPGIPSSPKDGGLRQGTPRKKARDTPKRQNLRPIYAPLLHFFKQLYNNTIHLFSALPSTSLPYICSKSAVPSINLCRPISTSPT
jgi:hypothetical protein